MITDKWTIRELWCGYCAKYIRGYQEQLQDHLNKCEVELCNKFKLKGKDDTQRSQSA